MQGKQQRSDVIRNTYGNIYNAGTTHPFLKHFKITSFPDRAPSLPKHHRHKREAYIAKTVERRKRDQKILNKLNIITDLLAQRSAQFDSNQNADIIDRVLNEVVEMKSNNTTNNCDCNMEGQWVSEAAGGIFDIKREACKKQSNLPHQKANDKCHNGFMNCKEWKTNITFPFTNNSQYIIVTGIDDRDKLVATFMGECRFSRKHELIQGSWLIVSHSRDCESLGTSAKLVGDVWRRDNIDRLRSHHLSSLNKMKSKKDNKEKDEEESCTIDNNSTSPKAHRHHIIQTTESSDIDQKVTKKSKKNIKTTMLRIKLH